MAMHNLEDINQILFNADLFGTQCAHNPGMEGEYFHIAAALLEENINSYEAFTTSLDFWMWPGFTHAHPKTKATYQAIKVILERHA